MQHIAYKILIAKTAILLFSNIPKRVKSLDKNKELQLIGLHNVNASFIKRFQSDTSIIFNLPNLNIRPCTKKRDYISIATLKLVKSSKLSQIKVNYRTYKPKSKQLNLTIIQKQLGQRILFLQNVGQE